MDKVSMKSSQTLPIWERSRPSRGHRSAVDGALAAHRQRRMEREQRVQERINADQFVQQNDFFPQPNLINQATNQQNYSNINNDASYYGDLSPAVDSPQVDSYQIQPETQGISAEESIVNAQPEVETLPQFPRQMEDLFNEAQLGSVKNQALSEVEREIENPEQGPVEDVPKGSYVDYEV